MLSDHTNKPPESNNNTYVGLKEYFTRWLESLERFYEERDLRYTERSIASQRAIEDAFRAAKEAVTKAENATEKRFDCVSADTPILCADLVWRPAGELAVGDELVTFDEESPTRRGRMFRKGTVISNSIREDVLFLVSTPEGNVRCNSNHPWLVRRPRSTNTGTTDGIWEWVKTTGLKVGDEVLHAVDVWDADTSWEAGWLAGMYDGEGCLCLNKNGGVQLSLAQRESDTSTRIERVLSDRLRSFVAHRQEAGTRSTRYNTLPFFHFIISTRSDVMKILGSVRPPRLIHKSDGVWENKPLGGKNRRTIVSSIREMGVGEIAVLGTSTRTYIASGFAMHNSVNEFRNSLKDLSETFFTKGSAAQLDSKYEQRFARIELDQQRSSERSQLFVTRDMMDSTQATMKSEMRRVEDATRSETQRINDALTNRVEPLEQFQKEFTNRLVLIGSVITIINIAIAIASHFIK